MSTEQLPQFCTIHKAGATNAKIAKWRTESFNHFPKLGSFIVCIKRMVFRSRPAVYVLYKLEFAELYMKTLYLIGGTMGVGKTTVSQQLKKGSDYNKHFKNNSEYGIS